MDQETSSTQRSVGDQQQADQYFDVPLQTPAAGARKSVVVVSRGTPVAPTSCGITGTLGRTTAKDIVPARIVGSSAAAVALRHAVSRAARSRPLRALLVGAAGAGSRHLAAGIHADSERCGELVHLDVSALAEAEIAGRLFGDGQHEGGLLERARGGTLVLEGLECVPVHLQAQLASAMSTGMATTCEIETDARDVHVIGLVSDSLTAHLESGALSKRLYGLLSESLIVIPSLRERDDDAIDIAQDQLARLNGETGSSKRLSDDLVSRIRSHDWPGNVDELKHAIRSLHVAAKNIDIIEPNERVVPALCSHDRRVIRSLVGRSVWDVQRLLVTETLSSTCGDKKRTAGLLGISLKTLYNRLHVYD